MKTFPYKAIEPGAGTAPEETPAERMWRLHYQSPLDKLTARIMETPDEYCDEPTAHGDNVCRIMRETYEKHKPKGFWARRRERLDKRWYYTDSLMFEIYQRVYKLMNVPTFDERKAYAALLADKARLDHLEELMKVGLVSLNGSAHTSTSGKASSRTRAFVGSKDELRIPWAETIRGAIDNSITHQNRPRDKNPLGLMPMSTTGNRTDLVEITPLSEEVQVEQVS